MEYLQKAGKRDVTEVFEAMKNLRTQHRFSTRGFSKDKTLRHTGSFPAWMMFDPEYRKYFDPSMDVHERKKNMEAFYKRFPMFKS